MKPYFQEDGITIYNADCREVLPSLEAGSVDLVLTDPPYGITSCRWDSPIPLDFMWAELLRVGKQTAAFIFTASQPFTSALVMSNPELFRHEWIWLKNMGSNFANTVREPMKEHESVLVFSRGRWTYNKQMQERTGEGAGRAKYKLNSVSNSENYRKFKRQNPWTGEMRVPSSWQKFNRETGLHPTQKPVELMQYLVNTYSNAGDVVLDFTCGSGTTLVAAKKLGRRAIGADTEESYCEVAAKRLSQRVLPLTA